LGGGVVGEVGLSDIGSSLVLPYWDLERKELLMLGDLGTTLLFTVRLSLMGA